MVDLVYSRLNRQEKATCKMDVTFALNKPETQSGRDYELFHKRERRTNSSDSRLEAIVKTMGFSACICVEEAQVGSVSRKSHSDGVVLRRMRSNPPSSIWSSKEK